MNEASAAARRCGGNFGAIPAPRFNRVALQAFGDLRRAGLDTPLPAGDTGIDRLPIALSNLQLDQRSAVRAAGGGCDSGTYEIGGIIDPIFADGFE